MPKLNSTKGFPIFLTSSSDRAVGVGGLAGTITAQLSKDGGLTFADVTANITISEMSIDGWYWITPAATERDTRGINSWHFSDTGVNDYPYIEEVDDADGLDFQEVLRVLLAAAAGKSTDMNTGAPKYRDLGDTKNRISGTSDQTGRLTSTVDATP